MFEVVQNFPGYENSLIIFAAEFFNKKVTVYEIKNAEVVNYRILDTLIDQAYSVHYLDINADGKYELLVNNHEKDNTKAGIFLYEVPEDIFSGVFKRTQIASGFKNAFSLLIPNMCPGFPYPVKPTPTSPVHILIAGDGDYSAHLMRPDGKGGY